MEDINEGMLTNVKEDKNEKDEEDKNKNKEKNSEKF